MRAVADKVGWAWVVAAVPISLWLGQGGAPCPPEGPPPGQACLMVLIGPDSTLLTLAVLGAIGMLLERAAHPRLSGGIVAAAGLLAGAWAATHQFLGGAWHVPRVPAVMVLVVPPLITATGRFTRSLRHDGAHQASSRASAHMADSSDRHSPDHPHRWHP